MRRYVHFVENASLREQVRTRKESWQGAPLIDTIRNSRMIVQLSLKGCQFISKEALLLVVTNKQLRGINLSDCKKVDDEVVSKLIFSNRALEKLDFSMCSLLTNKSIELFSSLPMLRTVNLAMCTGVTDEAISFLARTQTLESLSINGCSDIKCRFNAFQNHRSLTYLDVSATGISDTEISIISTITQLHTLILDNCDQLTKSSIRNFPQLRNLEILSISHCPGITSLNSLYGCAKLQVLIIANNPQLIDREVASLNRILTLKSLNLNRCNLQMAIVKVLTELPSLRALSLSGCRNVTDAVFPVLASSTSLSKLDISDTSISKAALKRVSNQFISPVVFQAYVKLHGVVDFSESTGIKKSTFELALSTPGVVEMNLSNCSQIDDAAFRKIAKNHASLVKCIITGCKVTPRVFQNFDGPIREFALNAVFDACNAIDLSHCPQVNDELMDLISRNRSAKDVNVSFCDRVSDTGIIALSRSSTIEVLSMRGMVRATKTAFVSLASMPNVVSVDLRENHSIDNETLVAWTKSTTLESFQFTFNDSFTSDGNFFAGRQEINNGALLVSFVDMFGEINLSGCYAIEDHVLRSTLAHPKLGKVCLSGCNAITKLSVITIFRNLGITHVDIRDCPQLDISSVAIPEVARSSSVVSLLMEGIPLLSDEALRLVSLFPKLEEISLTCGDLVSKEGLTALLEKCHLLRRISVSGVAADDDCVCCSVFDSLSELQRLEFLRFRDCSGSFTKDEVSKLCMATKRLTDIEFESCDNLSDEALFPLQAVSSLSRLIVKDCPGVTGANFPMCMNLQELDVSGCENFDLKTIEMIVSKFDIKSYNFSGTCIDDSCIAKIVNRKSVHRLVLQSCQNITDVGLASLARTRSVQECVLSDLPQVTSRAFRGMQKMPLLDIVMQLINITKGVDLSEFEDLTSTSLMCIAKNQNLTSLVLDNCPQLDNASMKIIGEGALNLKHLSLKQCDQLTDISSIRNLKCLEDLNLFGCWRLVDVQIDHCVHHPTLVCLCISRCNVSEEVLINVVSRLGMRGICMSGIPAVSLPVLEPLKSSTTMQHLDISNCSGVNNDCLKILGQVSSLSILELSGCVAITDAGVGHLADLSLHQLFLGKTKVTGMTLPPLLQKGTLETLEVADCPMNPECFRMFRSCKLQQLDMSGVKNITTKEMQQIFARNVDIECINFDGCQKVTTAAFEAERATYLTPEQREIRTHAQNIRRSIEDPTPQEEAEEDSIGLYFANSNSGSLHSSNSNLLTAGSIGAGSIGAGSIGAGSIGAGGKGSGDDPDDDILGDLDPSSEQIMIGSMDALNALSEGSEDDLVGFGGGDFLRMGGSSNDILFGDDLSYSKNAAPGLDDLSTTLPSPPVVSVGDVAKSASTTLGMMSTDSPRMSSPPNVASTDSKIGRLRRRLKEVELAFLDFPENSNTSGQTNSNWPTSRFLACLIDEFNSCVSMGDSSHEKRIRCPHELEKQIIEFERTMAEIVGVIIPSWNRMLRSKNSVSF